MGVCSIPCSHSNTASPAGNIPINPQPLRAAAGERLKQCGNGIGLIVSHLEQDPTVDDHLGNPAPEPTEDIKAIATPGHTDDSLSFLLTGPAAGAAVLTGDTVLGRGTTVVATRWRQ